LNIVFITLPGSSWASGSRFCFTSILPFHAMTPDQLAILLLSHSSVVQEYERHDDSSEKKKQRGIVSILYALGRSYK